ENTSAPTMIVLHTIIGWPAPTKQDSGAAHGAALGEDEVAATKELLGFDPTVDFPVEESVLAPSRAVVDRGQRAHAGWDERMATWRRDNPERAALLDRVVDARGREGLDEAL